MEIFLLQIIKFFLSDKYIKQLFSPCLITLSQTSSIVSGVWPALIFGISTNEILTSRRVARGGEGGRTPPLPNLHKLILPKTGSMHVFDAML